MAEDEEKMMTRIIIFVWILLDFVNSAEAITFYGSVEEPESSAHIDMDKPDERHVMVYLEKFDEEYEVNIIDIDVDKKGEVSMELEFDLPVTHPKALNIPTVQFHLSDEDSANYLDFVNKD